MKPVLIDIELLEPGCQPQLITSTDQQAAYDLPAAITPDGQIVSRWRLTDEDRIRVCAGADLYVFIRTFGHPLQPMSIIVGPEVQ
jgi:hypothetical protein